MKKIKFLFLGLWALFSLSSCKENPDVVPQSYELFLEFRDENGSNLLNDFDVNRLENDVTIKTDPWPGYAVAFGIWAIFIWTTTKPRRRRR